MRIGIDCRFAVEVRPRGTGRYIGHLIEHLTKVDSRNEYIFYVHHWENHERLPRSSRGEIRVIPFRFYPAWEQVLLPLRARADRLDLLHCPGTTGPLFLPPDLAYVATIHDVSFLLPEHVMPRPRIMYQRLGWTYRRWVVPRLARRATRVITVSNYTRAEIVRVLGIDPSKTRVIYHGLTLDRPTQVPGAIQPYPGIPERYMLCVGGNAPHKNVDRVIRVFASLVATRRNRGYGLVVLGMPESDASLKSRQTISHTCPTQVSFVPFVATENELAQLYRHAVVVLSPSTNESFGLPALEAMTAGVPVITSNVAAIPEIVGDAALLVDPLSDAGIEEAILKILNSESLRQKYVDQGHARIARFSWEQAAMETLRVYDEVAPR